MRLLLLLISIFPLLCRATTDNSFVPLDPEVECLPGHPQQGDSFCGEVAEGATCGASGACGSFNQYPVDYTLPGPPPASFALPANYTNHTMPESEFPTVPVQRHTCFDLCDQGGYAGDCNAPSGSGNGPHLGLTCWRGIRGAFDWLTPPSLDNDDASVAEPFMQVFEACRRTCVYSTSSTSTTNPTSP